MHRPDLNIQPYRHDPNHWGVSLVNNAELMIACLEAAGARSVLEVGAYAGDLTELLLDWAATVGGRVGAIDPSPQGPLEQLDADRDDLELIRATSHEALREVELTDALVIDGDHNYWTVREELRIIAERAEGRPLPLLLFHDVCWPHARRDDYFAPDQIPEDFRQEIVPGGHVMVGEDLPADHGIPYVNPAAHEGGPRNGVLTAIEDFVEDRGGARLAVIPSFFGLGVVWDEAAPWAGAVAAVVDPFDRNPVLERLEANRALHLAHLVTLQRKHNALNEHVHEVTTANERLEERIARRDELLRKLLESGTFGVAEGLSRVRQRGAPAISKAEVRDVLSD